MTLGEIIKEYSQDHSMSQFIKDSGLSKAYTYMLINNKNNNGAPIVPSIETVKKVSKGIHRSFNDVLLMLDPDLKVSTRDDSQETESALDLSDEETRIILRYRQMSDAEKNLVCNMMQIKRDEEFPSTQIEKLG